jgi:hypothetical protein
VTFPPLDLLVQCQAEEYLPPVKQLIADSDNCGRDLTYFSSWTAATAYRTMSAGAAGARDVFMALLADWYFKGEMNGWIAFAVKKYKTDRYMEFMGARTCSDIITSSHRNNEPAVLMMAQGLSPAMRELTETHTTLLAGTVVYSTKEEA